MKSLFKYTLLSLFICGGTTAMAQNQNQNRANSGINELQLRKLVFSQSAIKQLYVDSVDDKGN